MLGDVTGLSSSERSTNLENSSSSVGQSEVVSVPPHRSAQTSVTKQNFTSI
jgi:hypothetical protein